MASKRKRKTTSQREDLSKPSTWRRQHGGFTEPFRDADPDTGVIVTHRRAVDLLGKLETNGTISPVMRDAGDTFHTQFRSAALDTLSVASLVRVSHSTGDSVTERAFAARRKVADAIASLGGVDSAAGSCVWHVVGCETSIREWALRQGWGGRTVGHSQAQGILVAALGVLAGHYKLDTTASVRRAPRADRVALAQAA